MRTAGAATAHMFIINPLAGHGMDNLFSTHPDVENRVAALQEIAREQMGLNAQMNTQMSERFNVAGAMLVKLFGRHDAEVGAFASRASRVRDIGILSALYGRVFFVALGLVGALGAAAIYALAKSLDNGGTPHVGSIYGIGTDGRNGATLTRQTAGGYQLGTTFSAAGNSSPEIRSTVAQFTTSLAATFGAAMQTFGLRQGDVRAGFAADNDDPSAGRITIRGADGRVLADSFARYAASASKGFEEFAADAGRVLRDALVAADLPGHAADQRCGGGSAGPCVSAAAIARA